MEAHTEKCAVGRYRGAKKQRVGQQGVRPQVRKREERKLLATSQKRHKESKDPPGNPDSCQPRGYDSGPGNGCALPRLPRAAYPWIVSLRILRAGFQRRKDAAPPYSPDTGRRLLVRRPVATGPDELFRRRGSYLISHYWNLVGNWHRHIGRQAGQIGRAHD